MSKLTNIEPDRVYLNFLFSEEKYSHLKNQSDIQDFISLLYQYAYTKGYMFGHNDGYECARHVLGSK